MIGFCKTPQAPSLPHLHGRCLKRNSFFLRMALRKLVHTFCLRKLWFFFKTGQTPQKLLEPLSHLAKDQTFGSFEGFFKVQFHLVHRKTGKFQCKNGKDD